MPKKINGHQPTEMCRCCAGACCKGYAGTAWPEDTLLITETDDLEEAIHQLLKSGKWSIDWWEGDPRPDKDEASRGLYLRPAHVDSRYKVFDASWGGTCILLGENGCELPFEKRPAQCRAVIPKGTIKETCDIDSGYTKLEGALAWWPYQEVLQRVGSSIRDSS